MKKGCLSMFVVLLAQVAGLIAATVGGAVYAQQIQAKECYAYARLHALPDLSYLAFSRAVIATNQSRSHTCVFTDNRTGFPVSMQFAPPDVPYGSDTLSVMSMAVP